MQNDPQRIQQQGRPQEVSGETRGVEGQSGESARGAETKKRRRKEIEVGERFGRLVIVGVLSRKYGMGRSDCLCDCGARRAVYNNHIFDGLTRSCGCLCRDQASVKNSKYGLLRVSDIRSMRTSSEHSTWRSMMERCETKTHHAYHHYGGRGIRVCERWRKFSNFFDDMGIRPDGLSLERIDNNGNYEPSNCRWDTQNNQANNRRGNRFITVNGVTKTVSQWSASIGISPQSLNARIKSGMSPEQAVSMIPKPPVKLRLNETELTIKEWAAKLGITIAVIYSGLRMGKPITDVLVRKPSSKSSEHQEPRLGFLEAHPAESKPSP